MNEPSSNLSQNRKSSRDLENKQIRILLERQKEQILAEVRSEIQKHELELLILSEWKLIMLLQDVSNPGEINYYCKKKLSEQNRDLRETCIRNMRDMEELQKSHVLQVEELSK